MADDLKYHQQNMSTTKSDDQKLATDPNNNQSGQKSTNLDYQVRTDSKYQLMSENMQTNDKTTSKDCCLINI